MSKSVDLSQYYYNKTYIDTNFINKTNIVDNLTSTDTDKPLSANQGKVLKTAVDGKASSSHTHSKTDISDFHSLSNVATSGSYTDLSNKPNIPSKTSDITNDGDGTNAFIKDNDSRLTDSRTPTSHTHGNLSNDGKIGSTAKLPIITGTNGILTTGNSSIAYGQVDSTSTATALRHRPRPSRWTAH